jgi:MFS family permease
MTASGDTIQTEVARHMPSMAARWYVLIMMCLVYTLSIADRYVTSTVLEPIRSELHLTNLGVALVTTWPLVLFYVFLGLPVSWLIDRYSRRNIIAISMVAWSVMTTLTGLARNQMQFVLARIGVGIGEAGGTPGANSILSDYFPAARRPMALTIFSLGAPLGAFVAYQIAGQIADRYGWRQVFMVLGIPGVLAGLAVWLTVREPHRGRLDHKDDIVAPPFLETMRFLWQQRAAVHVMVGSAVTALWGWGLMYWTPTYLQLTFSLTPGQAGDITGNMHLWGGSLATVFTGWLLALPPMRDPRRVVRLMGYWIGLATFASIGVYWTHSLWWAKACLWVFVPAIYFYIGPCFGLLNNLAPPPMRAMFCATTLFIANVGNLWITPALIGAISDWFGPGHVANPDSLRFAMLCIAPTGFWATAHYFWSIRDIVANEERATGVPVEH